MSYQSNWAQPATQPRAASHMWLLTLTWKVGLSSLAVSCRATPVSSLARAQSMERHTGRFTEPLTETPMELRRQWRRERAAPVLVRRLVPRQTVRCGPTDLRGRRASSLWSTATQIFLGTPATHRNTPTDVAQRCRPRRRNMNRPRRRWCRFLKTFTARFVQTISSLCGFLGPLCSLARSDAGGPTQLPHETLRLGCCAVESWRSISRKAACARNDNL